MVVTQFSETWKDLPGPRWTQLLFDLKHKTEVLQFQKEAMSV